MGENIKLTKKTCLYFCPAIQFDILWKPTKVFLLPQPSHLAESQ